MVTPATPVTVETVTAEAVTATPVQEPAQNAAPRVAVDQNTLCPPAPTAPSLPQIAPGEGAQAVQWQVHEIVLSAAQSYQNAYTDVTVTANFSGPNNEQRLVAGFWDSGSRFVVRFTPTTPGDWSYTIESNPADAGLTQTGSFTASPAEASAKGFVRRDPAYPYSFVYDNGDRYFMMGNTYYDMIRTACAGDRWQEGVLQSASYGINKIRIFVHSLGFGQDHVHPDYYPAVFPFIDDNHDQISIDYWRKVDEVMLFLAEHGMVADLILFMKPFVTDDDLAFGTLEQDERYVRYILARYAAFPNVIWCVTNEWEFTGRDEMYWDHIGGIVRNEDPWMEQATPDGTALRALSIHHATGGRNGGKFKFFDSDWPVHASVQYGVRNVRFVNGDEWGNYSIVQNHGNAMPVVNDEYGYIGEDEPLVLTREQHRRALWGIVVGGGYASAGDARIFEDGPDGGLARVIMTGHWHEAVEYEDIKRVVDFWTTQGIPYWRMMPQNERVQAGANVYVLGTAADAADTREYVAYAAAGGEFTLTLPKGTYTVSRFDPRTGESAALEDVTGGNASFALPDTQDWVLRLTQADS